MIAPSADPDTLVRIAKLERRQGLLTVLLVFVLSASILGARLAPQASQTAVVEATEFRLVDEDGLLQARLAADFGDPQLALMSASGAIASVTPRLISLSRLDDLVNTASFSAAIGADSTAAGLYVAGGDGGFRFSSVDGAPSLEVLDSDGNVRVIIGKATLSRTRTGSTEITAESSIVLFDADGNVVWRAPLG
jgi:hypothetical protein